MAKASPPPEPTREELGWIYPHEGVPEIGQWCDIILRGQVGVGKPIWKGRYVGGAFAGVAAPLSEVFAWKPR